MTPEQMMHALGQNDDSQAWQKEERFAIMDEIAADMRLSARGLLGREAEVQQRVADKCDMYDFTGGCDPDWFVPKMIAMYADEEG